MDLSALNWAARNKSDSTNVEQCAVISNWELAKSIYTANNLFALNQCRHKKNTSLDLYWKKERVRSVLCPCS
jgi:hypothetical protein